MYDPTSSRTQSGKPSYKAARYAAAAEASDGGAAVDMEEKLSNFPQIFEHSGAFKVGA